MAKPFRNLLFGMTVLLLGGCQTVFNLVGVAVPLSASRSRVYDGSYQGRIRLVQGKPTMCPVETGERVLMVGDGVLWYAYNPQVFFTAPVASDGKIDSTDGETSLEGQVVGNHLAAVVKSPDCTSTISMNFIYNHS